MRAFRAHILQRCAGFSNAHKTYWGVFFKHNYRLLLRDKHFMSLGLTCVRKIHIKKGINIVGNSTFSG